MTVPVPGSLTYTYVEDGVTTVFPYPVRFLEPGELTVIREDASGAQSTLVYNVDYTASGAGNPSGGSITRTAVTSGGKITITRSTEAKQLVDLQDAQRNPAEAVELQLDRLTMVDQDQGREIGRSVKVGYGAGEQVLPFPRPDQFIGWNSAGTKLENKNMQGLGLVQVIDEDDMASDSRSKVPTQGSVKAYVDSRFQDVNLTVLVPSDYPNIKAALLDLGQRPHKPNTIIEIRMESGYTEDTGYYLHGGDYSHIWLTSVDNVVPVSIKNNSPWSSPIQNGHYYLRDCLGPIHAFLGDAQYSGGKYACGLNVWGGAYRSTSTDGTKPHGLRNVGMPALGDGSPDDLSIQCGYNLFAWHNAQIDISGGDYSGAAQRCLWLSRGSHTNAALANISGCRSTGVLNANDGGAYVTRGAWANLEYANASNSSCRGVTAIRSFINADSIDVHNCVLAGLYVEYGGTIVASNARTNNSPTPSGSNPWVPQEQDLGGATAFNDLIGQGIIFCTAYGGFPRRGFYNDASTTWMYEMFSNGDIQLRTESGGAKVGHGSGGIMLPRAE